MPEIKFPEVRFPEIKLPEGLRDMSREDIQKAMSDVKMPDVKMPDVKLPKRSDIARGVEKALPSRAGLSPVPFVVLAMLGGLIVGWILATSPLTGPRISAAMGGVRHKIDEWRSGTDDLDELDTEPDAFRDAYGKPMASDTYKAAGSTGTAGTDTAVGVGPGRRSSTSSSAARDGGSSVGAEGISSERF
ncbi:MAG TPA: hypothetical protein VGQ58_06250 [Candidatus Limnocylindrales bacterium]|jgi:hypothetical protein|nr:hypothetical protein [Candidatus Limnocylindrales bacterium]